MTTVPAAPRPPFTPLGVVCDLDGLLVDSEPAWGRAEEALVRSYGRVWDPAVQREALGSGPDEAAAIFAAFVGEGDVRAVGHRLLQEAVKQFDRGIEPRPGARALLRPLAGALPIGVATNSQRVLAELALASSDLAGYVDLLVCAEDVAAAKPAPDPYLAACAGLGVEPARAVGLEDSRRGAEAARAAGLWVIGCPSLAGTVLPAAHVVVGSLEELDSHGWLSR
jgi:HAD superfamily hydrolase (TIGR01509 family)